MVGRELGQVLVDPCFEPICLLISYREDADVDQESTEVMSRLPGWTRIDARMSDRLLRSDRSEQAPRGGLEQPSHH
jgi:hypothetical protein